MKISKSALNATIEQFFGYKDGEGNPPCSKEEVQYAIDIIQAYSERLPDFVTILKAIVGDNTTVHDWVAANEALIAMED